MVVLVPPLEGLLSLLVPGLPHEGVPLVGAEVSGVLRVCHSEKVLNESKNIFKKKIITFFILHAL